MSIMNNTLKEAIFIAINKTPLKSHFDFSFKSQKYNLFDILDGIFLVLKEGITWRTLKYFSSQKIHWSTYYKAFCNINKYNIFKKTYIETLQKYIKKGTKNKLRKQLTDTTFINNRYGRDQLGRNPYMKNKNVTKITLITDKFGIPINVACEAGNINDSKILQKQLIKKDYLIDINILKKYSKYFLADKGYDSSIIRKILKEFKLIPIIPYNKRNTKNRKKIKKLTKKLYKIYLERIRIEHTNNIIKSYKRLLIRYDQKCSTYEHFLYMSLSNNLIKKL